MAQPILTSDEKTKGQRLALTLFVISALLMLGTVSLGFFIEKESLSLVMRQLEPARIRTFELPQSGMGLVFPFAFGLPLGMVVLFISSVLMSQPKAAKIRSWIVWSFLIFSLVVLVPMIFGREASNLYFGTGGILILIAIIIAFRFWARYRAGLPAELRPMANFKGLGYLCFGLAAWHICGFSNAPCFAAFPEKMLELDIRSFAMGQLKAIMAYFVLGWVLTAIGFYKSVPEKNG